MKALITGVCGFTGHYLAQTLAEAGYEVFGLALMPAEVPHVTRVFESDLSNVTQLHDVICDIRPDVVAHLAAISYITHREVDEIYSINLLGTRHLLEALVSAGSDCRSVLLVSSANVYGNSVAGVLTEDTPLAPGNDYAVSKVAMEYLAGLYADRLPIVITRPFNYTGLGQTEVFLLPKIVGHVWRQEPVIELGNMDVARDFSDVRTVAQYYWRLLETPKARGGTFNVCSGRAYTLQEVLDMVRAISGHEFEVRLNPAFARPHEAKLLLGDRGRLTAMVGEIPDIPLQETLRWMIKGAA